MVFRLLMQLLARDEKLVQRLSESYPIRRAAQLLVSYFNQGKILAEDKKLTPEQFRDLFRQFTVKAQEQIKRVQERVKKDK